MPSNRAGRARSSWIAAAVAVGVAVAWGVVPGTAMVSNVTFTDVNLEVPGGSANLGTGVPGNDPNNYDPGSIGTRPAFGWYLHNVDNIHFNGGSAHFVNNDNRPAVIVDAGSAVTFDRFTEERGTGSPYDTRFQNVAGYCVTNGVNTTGGAVRVSQTGSTGNCNPPVTVGGLTVADAGNAADWSIQSGLSSGVAQYGDRAYTLTAVPSGLAGAQSIRGANDSKTATADPLVRFTVNRQVTVSVAVDTRQGRLPWMDSGWADTGTRITNSESPSRAFEVYARAFPAGQVTLGPNAGPATGSSMYTVIVL